MKRVLIIDNNSAHLESLKDLIVEKTGAAEFRLKDPRLLADDDLYWAQLVVISGGWGRSIVKNPETFARMVQYVVDHKKPTIGICLGAEAIATYFGASLQENTVRRVGNVRAHFSPQFAAELGIGSDSEMVYEFHKWFIPAIAAPLESLATSKDGIEILRHHSLPLWGLQFHPEVRRKGNRGHDIFAHILVAVGVLS